LIPTGSVADTGPLIVSVARLDRLVPSAVVVTVSAPADALQLTVNAAVTVAPPVTVTVCGLTLVTAQFDGTPESVTM